MPKPKRGPRLGGGPAHQRHLLANQASDLFVHGRITTTLTKAKTLRPYAEKLITKAKAGDLHARRQVLAKLRDRDVVAYLFEDVGPRFADRNGGYTRILKLGPRQGDAAPMAVIELVEQADGSGEEAVEESKQGRMRGLFGRRRRRSRDAGGPDTAYLSDDYDEDEETSETSSETSSSESSEEPPPAAAEAPDAGSDTDEAGLAAQAPPGPAQEPSSPDDLGAGNPVDATGDEPDAGAATGKDVD